MQWASAVIATPFLTAAIDPERAYGLTRAASKALAVPMHCELVTLTETSAIFTWFTGDVTRPDHIGRFTPVPADTQLMLGEVGGKLREVFYDKTPTPYHYVEVTGLEPGKSYVAVAKSGGLPALPAASFGGSPLPSSGLNVAPPPIVFTTPKPPPGDYLFSVALANDMHLGENVAGLITSVGGVGLPPGFAQLEGRPPYPEVMAAALAQETKLRGADMLVVAGDISAESEPANLVRARHYLDRFGSLGKDYFVSRGNHDRVHDTKDTKSCSTSPKHGKYHDCFRDQFRNNGTTWFAAERFGMRVIGLDTYDTIGNGGAFGALSPRQMDFLRRELNDDGDRPTMVFGHHPVALDSVLTAVPPVVFGLDRKQARALEGLYRDHSGVFLHHAGHTHRNKRARSTIAKNTVFQEVSATKEYPGGFTLVRIFTGGFASNFYKFKSPMALEWSERTRPEYLGLGPFYLFGNQYDRNYVVKRDLSGLQRA